MEKDLPIGHIYENDSKTCKIEFLKKIGSGGFAITYKALLYKRKSTSEPYETGVYVAVKEYFPDQKSENCCALGRRKDDNSVLFVESGELEGQCERFWEKFKEEAKVLSSLNGEKNIVKVIQIDNKPYFEKNNTAYYVMEFINGGTLEKWIEDKGSFNEDFKTAWEFLRPVCLSLKKVHAAKPNPYYHLDISPKNILIKTVDKQIFPVLIDFGACKISSSGENSSELTGIAPNSGSYSAPEIRKSAKGTKVGAFTDIYSLGAIFYFIMRGTNPPIFDENFTVMDINPASIDKNLFLIMQKTMNYKKTDRFQTVDELIKECDRLSGYKEPEPKNISGKTVLRDNSTSGQTEVRPEETKDSPVTPENQNKEEKKEAIGGVVDILIINSEKKENQKKEKEVPKIGPNDLCPCGTGLKFKNCHGKHLFEEPIPSTPPPTPQPKLTSQPKPTLQPKESWLKKYWKWLVLLVVCLMVVVSAISYFMNNPAEKEERVVQLSPEELATKQLQEQITAVQNGEMSASELISQFTKDAYFVIIEDGGVEVGSIADPSHQIMHLLTTDSRIDMVRDYQVKKIYRDNGDDKITSIDIEEIKQ